MSNKQSGLGDNYFVGGYDLSGDTNSLSSIASPLATIDTTGINKFGHERIGGLHDGDLQWVSYFDPAANQAHPVLSALPTADVGAMYCRGTAIGNPVASMVGKQINYDPTRSAAGDLTVKVQCQANGYGLSWGQQLTAGIRTDTAATNGTSFDGGSGFATPAVPASGTPATNTSPLPAQVVISGGTLSNVVVNGSSVGTGDGTYTVPPGATITLSYTVAPTWTWTLQTANGWVAYLQAFAFTGTDATVTIQDSADNSTWANLTSGVFTQITAGRQTQRLAVGGTAVVRRYTRAITTTTGGFTSLAFAVALTRYLVPSDI